MAKDEEVEKEIVDKLSKYGKQVDSFDGKIDIPHLDDSIISIADPRFYTDCLVLPIHERADTSFTDSMQDIEPLTSSSRSRSKTWHGRGSNVHKLSRGRSLSVGTMALRASTDDYYDEMAKREKAELERLLRSAGLPVRS